MSEMSSDVSPDAVAGLPDASERFTALHRASALAREYPLVGLLLRELQGPELLRAGQLLARVDPADVLREHPSTGTVTVAVTGHGTLNPMMPALTAELARHGLLLQPWVSDFDGYVFDLSDPYSALYGSAPDLVACVLDPMVVFDEIATPWDVADVQRKLDDKVKLVEWLVERFENTSDGTLVLNTIPLPRRFCAQLVDHGSRARLGAAWRTANARLLEISQRHQATVVIDVDPLLAEGLPVEDVRLSTYAKVHLSPAFLARYARELGHLARHLTGRTKKALALDLDNTLWGGVLGDDGVDGIEVAGTYRGEAFEAFQRVVKQLGAQGVLLTAVSKNDIEPVRQVLREHPDMTLREDDFVRVTANWRLKPQNVRETAEVLNIKADSFVFVDDSPYECGLMRHSLPEVTTVQLDSEPALHIERLLADGWFDVRNLTAEDRARPTLYRDESARSDFLQEFDSLEDYLRELRVEVRLAPVREAEINRVAQLTLRTNQFNLTTMRKQPPEIRELSSTPDRMVLAIHAKDRFGENGLVGALLTRRDGDVAHIENFLLSCRVFSRGIEQACLSAVLKHARMDGCRAVFGEYRPTLKNAGVKDLYPRYGFEPVTEEDSRSTFRHDLRAIVAVPEHLHLTEELDGGAR